MVKDMNKLVEVNHNLIKEKAAEKDINNIFE